MKSHLVEKDRDLSLIPGLALDHSQPLDQGRDLAPAHNLVRVPALPVVHPHLKGKKQEQNEKKSQIYETAGLQTQEGQQAENMNMSLIEIEEKIEIVTEITILKVVDETAHVPMGHPAKVVVA